MFYKFSANGDSLKTFKTDTPEDITPTTPIPILDFNFFFAPLYSAIQNSDIENTIKGFDQLTEAYSKGLTISFNQPDGYSDFYDICFDFLCSCPENEVIIHYLRCIQFGILSDNILLNCLSSSEEFSLQLTYSIDERGSCLFENGLNVLSHTILGYSKDIFVKLVYLLESSGFPESLSTGDFLTLRLFGQVFIQFSKFVNEQSFIMMLPIVKFYFSRGLTDIGVMILQTLLSNNEKFLFRIFNFIRLTKRNLESIQMGSDDIIYSLPEWYYQEILETLSVHNIPPTIFLDLIKIVPMMPEQSKACDYYEILDQVMFQALSLINTAVSAYTGHFSPFFDENICLFLCQLILHDNSDIQSMACSLIEHVYSSEKWALLFRPEVLSKLLDNSSSLYSYKTRQRAIASILKCIIKCKNLEFYEFLMNSEFFYDNLFEFFNMESENISILGARAILTMLDCPDFDKTMTKNYFESFQELYNECETESLKLQYFLILNNLSSEE